MAKAKRAPAQSGADQGEAEVLKYLTQQNRPYSASTIHYHLQVDTESLVDIFNNLHGAVGKTALTKVLQNLVDREEIAVKAYGKQSVYVVRQDNLPTPSASELEEYDSKISKTKEELIQEREKTKVLQSTLSQLNNSLTMEEITARLEKLNEENEKMSKRLDELRSGGHRVDPTEKAAVDLKHSKYSSLLKSRKKLCNEIVGTLCESMGKKPKDFMEEVGLEPDTVA